MKFWNEKNVTFGTCLIAFEPGHSMSYNIACAPSEDSDQPAHPRSLIRVFAAHIVEPRIHSVFRRTAKTLMSLCGCAGWSESSLDAYEIHLCTLGMLCPGSFVSGKNRNIQTCICLRGRVFAFYIFFLFSWKMTSCSRKVWCLVFYFSTTVISCQSENVKHKKVEIVLSNFVISNNTQD